MEKSYADAYFPADIITPYAASTLLNGVPLNFDQQLDERLTALKLRAKYKKIG